MKPQGICPVCKRAVGLRPGDVAAKHASNLGRFYPATCDGTGKPADVALWVDAERARLVDAAAAEDRRRADARAECEQRITVSKVRELAARKDLAALDRLMAKRAKGGAL